MTARSTFFSKTALRSAVQTEPNFPPAGSTITPGLTDTFRAETLFGGIHLPQHEYWFALYQDGISLETIAYTPEGEASGLGYQPGGKLLENRKVQLIAGVALLDFDPPVWDVVTVRDVAGGLVYNKSLPGLNSVCVVLFEEPYTSINGPFRGRIPLPGPNSSLIQWRA